MQVLRGRSVPEDVVERGLEPETEEDRRRLLDFVVSQGAAVYYLGTCGGAPGSTRTLRFITENVEALTGFPRAMLV